MIVSLEQESTVTELQYRFTCKGQTISLAHSPNSTGEVAFAMEVSQASGEQLTLYFNLLDAPITASLSDRFSYKILKGNQRIGHLVGATMQTGHFFQGYQYFKVTLNEKEYTAYEVGFGTNGIYLCLYLGERLVAIIDKTLRVENQLDTYTLYIEDEADYTVTSMLALYYDLIRYENYRAKKIVSVNNVVLMSTDKELLSKYDPAFIPRILALEQ